jgi:hypothetical protein
MRKSCGRDRPKQLRRQAFNNHIASLAQRVGGDDGNTAARFRQIAPRLGVIAGGNRSEDEPGNARFEPTRDFEAHRAQAG